IGDVILGAPSSYVLDVTFRGRASHAGMHPEDGRSAIAAAARAVADFRLGRVDELSTANVGVISGGVAANIVPEVCSFVAEARAHDDAKLAELVQELLESISFAAETSDCRADVESRRSYRGYRFKRGDDVVRFATQALAEVGREPRFALSGGAADANIFNER